MLTLKFLNIRPGKSSRFPTILHSQPFLQKISTTFTFLTAYNDDEIAQESLRLITKSLFEHNGIVDQQIISFNEFIEVK